MSRIRRAFGLLNSSVHLTGSIKSATNGLAATPDQHRDLTGKIPIVGTLKGHDNFSSEYRYDVCVRNNGADPTIVFRVFGTKRPPPDPPKPPIARGQSGSGPPPSPQPQTDKQTEKLIQLPVKKEVITEGDWRKASPP